MEKGLNVMNITLSEKKKHFSKFLREAPTWQDRAVTVRLHCTFAPVSDRARDTQTDEIVALKKVRMDKEKDGELGTVCRITLHAQGIKAGRSKQAQVT